MLHSFDSVYGLRPVDGRKSFYGKAQVLIKGDDIFLQSYSTIVCGIVGGKLEKYWPYWSATTSRHIHSFLLSHNMPGINKKAWEAMGCKVAPVHSVGADYKVTYY